MHKHLRYLSATFLGILFCGASASGQQSTIPHAVRAVDALSTYPESAEGLRNFLGDIFAAMKSGDSGKSSAYLATLAIPDHGTWFLEKFGPCEGPRLAAKYGERQSQARETLEKIFDYAVKTGRTSVAVQVYQKDSDTSLRLVRAALQAMTSPAQIYSASGGNPADKSPRGLGSFVYIDGGFRSLDSQVMQALSTALLPAFAWAETSWDRC
jgi:hypothetical protein